MMIPMMVMTPPRHACCGAHGAATACDGCWVLGAHRIIVYVLCLLLLGWGAAIGPTTATAIPPIAAVDVVIPCSSAMTSPLQLTFTSSPSPSTNVTTSMLSGCDVASPLAILPPLLSGSGGDTRFAILYVVNCVFRQSVTIGNGTADLFNVRIVLMNVTTMPVAFITGNSLSAFPNGVQHAFSLQLGARAENVTVEATNCTLGAVSADGIATVLSVVALGSSGTGSGSRGAITSSLCVNCSLLAVNNTALAAISGSSATAAVLSLLATSWNVTCVHCGLSWSTSPVSNATVLGGSRSMLLSAMADTGFTLTLSDAEVAAATVGSLVVTSTGGWALIGSLGANAALVNASNVTVAIEDAANVAAVASGGGMAWVLSCVVYTSGASASLSDVQFDAVGLRVVSATAHFWAMILSLAEGDNGNNVTCTRCRFTATDSGTLTVSTPSSSGCVTILSVFIATYSAAHLHDVNMTVTNVTSLRASSFRDLAVILSFVKWHQNGEVVCRQCRATAVHVDTISATAATQYALVLSVMAGTNGASLQLEDVAMEARHTRAITAVATTYWALVLAAGKGSTGGMLNASRCRWNASNVSILDASVISLNVALVLSAYVDGSSTTSVATDLEMAASNVTNITATSATTYALALAVVVADVGSALSCTRCRFAAVDVVSIRTVSTASGYSLILSMLAGVDGSTISASSSLDLLASSVASINATAAYSYALVLSLVALERGSAIRLNSGAMQLTAHNIGTVSVIAANGVYALFLACLIRDNSTMSLQGGTSGVFTLSTLSTNGGSASPSVMPAAAAVSVLSRGAAVMLSVLGVGYNSTFDGDALAMLLVADPVLPVSVNVTSNNTVAMFLSVLSSGVVMCRGPWTLFAKQVNQNMSSVWSVSAVSQGQFGSIVAPLTALPLGGALNVTVRVGNMNAVTVTASMSAYLWVLKNASRLASVVLAVEVSRVQNVVVRGGSEAAVVWLLGSSPTAVSVPIQYVVAWCDTPLALLSMVPSQVVAARFIVDAYGSSVYTNSSVRLIGLSVLNATACLTAPLATLVIHRASFECQALGWPSVVVPGSLAFPVPSLVSLNGTLLTPGQLRTTSLGRTRKPSLAQTPHRWTYCSARLATATRVPPILRRSLKHRRHPVALCRSPLCHPCH